MKRNARKILPEISIHLLLLIFFYLFWRKATFTGNLPGDAADARYTTSLYEHWYSYFSDRSSLSGNFFFYPTKNTISFSDGYLFQGIIHSVFRLYGYSILRAWLLATVITHLIGTYSAYFLGKIFQFNYFSRLILIVFWSFNSVIWVQRGHVQNLAYPLMGYPILFSVLWFRNRGKRYSQFLFWLAGFSAETDLEQFQVNCKN